MWRTLACLLSLLSVIDADIELTCDFERDTCGFTNQEGLAAQWERKEMELDGKTGFMMVLETNNTSAKLAKMITPYFELDETPGCVSFDLYASGIKHFGVHQERDFGIVSVWTKPDQKPGWQRPEFDVDIDESTRFFFEAVLDGADAPLAAVDNVRLQLKKC